MRGTTLPARVQRRECQYFNPRSPCGERRELVVSSISSQQFQSTLPLRGTTETSKLTAQNLIFQSTLPLRGTTYMFGYRACQNFYFNPRSPCGERLCASASMSVCISFQSTLPLRGTTTLCASPDERYYFNPRSPCGERRGEHVGQHRQVHISIHAPLAGNDRQAEVSEHGHEYFNPRSPCGERRGITCDWAHASDFNPRSPCGERRSRRRRPCSGRYFNPRSPCGERRYMTDESPCYRNFNPRSPCGERHENKKNIANLTISIHAPLAGNDTKTRKTLRILLFQSTLPLRGTTLGRNR